MSFRTTQNKHETEIVSYPDGSAFGELPLLANMPVGGTLRATKPSHLLLLDEEAFWRLMTTCPHVRKAILGNMAQRFQRYQNMTLQQEKMASLGTLAAGLMHELNNPGAAARRAASQLRQNLERMLELGSRLSRTKLDPEQTECLAELKSRAMSSHKPLRMNSLEQSDAEEELATWMETAQIEGAWKLAPTLAGVGITWHDLECARTEFPVEVLADCLGWLEALISSMSLVGLVEDSIGRITELVHAVKSYAYEGKGARQSLNVNDSIHATLIILAHKMREKEIVVEREFDDSLPALQTELSGLNQVWTNLLDNAIDAVGPQGRHPHSHMVGAATGTRTARQTADHHQHRRQRPRAFRSKCSRASSIPSTQRRKLASAPDLGSVSLRALWSSLAERFGSPRNPDARSSSLRCPSRGRYLLF